MPCLRLPAPESERLALLDFVRSVRDRLQLCSEDVEHQVGIRCDWQLRKVGIEREPRRPAGGEPFVTPRIGPIPQVQGLARNGRLIPLSGLISHAYSIFNNWTASA